MKTREPDRRDHAERQGNARDDAAGRRDRAVNRGDDQADVSARIDDHLDRQADAADRLDLALWTAAQGHLSHPVRRRSLTERLGLR